MNYESTHIGANLSDKQSIPFPPNLLVSTRISHELNLQNTLTSCKDLNNLMIIEPDI